MTALQISPKNRKKGKKGDHKTHLTHIFLGDARVRNISTRDCAAGFVLQFYSVIRHILSADIVFRVFSFLHPPSMFHLLDPQNRSEFLNGRNRALIDAASAESDASHKCGSTCARVTAAKARKAAHERPTDNGASETAAYRIAPFRKETLARRAINWVSRVHVTQ